MKGFSELLLIVAGVVAGPLLVGVVSEFFGKEAPDWLPFLVVMMVGGVLYAVGVLRGPAIGVLIGVVVYALLVQYYPQRVDFMPTNVPAPF
jgi:hypothetical protein